MEPSILIARILTALYLSIGVGMTFSLSYYEHSIKKLMNDSTYLFLGGWVAISVGMVMVQFHNIWVNDWRLLITIVSWVVLIKGILLLAFPRFVNAFQPWFTTKGLRNYITPMVYILGLIFAYFGFFGADAI